MDRTAGTPSVVAMGRLKTVVSGNLNVNPLLRPADGTAGAGGSSERGG